MMKRALQLLVVILLLSGSIAVLAYAGLPYEPIGLRALTLNSYLYGEEPVAEFEADPTSGVAPLEVAFTNTSQGEFSDSRWDFGDGSTSTLEDPLHIYQTADTYTVTLTISGTLGTDAEVKTDYITVYEPAEAGFSAAPLKGPWPLTVTFKDESNGDYDACAWEFGDGNTSAECNPQHTYVKTGYYTVKLMVSGLGSSDTEIKPKYINAYPWLVYLPIVSNKQLGSEVDFLPLIMSSSGSALDSDSLGDR
jgi:PKD repeat protein